MGRSNNTPCLSPTYKNIQNFVCDKYRKSSIRCFFKLWGLSTACHLHYHGGQTGKFHPLVASIHHTPTHLSGGQRSGLPTTILAQAITVHPTCNKHLGQTNAHDLGNS
jgi:hypothetical protein